MKNSKILPILFLALTLSFCSKENTDEANESTSNLELQGQLQLCQNVDLIAGQNSDAGEFTVSQNSLGNLVLRYETMEGWELNAVHLYVGNCDEIPVTRSGNPKIGRFPIKVDLPNGTTVYEYVFEVVGDDFFCGCIAAHAEVSRDGQNETAWANGLDFSENSWAMYLEQCESCGAF